MGNGEWEIGNGEWGIASVAALPRNDMGPARNDMVILGRRIDPGRQDVAPTGGRFCNLPPPTYGGMESAFKGVLGTSKAGETSTDVNRCQHISTHVNTSQGRRGYPPYMGFAFLFGINLLVFIVTRSILFFPDFSCRFLFNLGYNY
jgi:hypothetical protein